MPIVPADSNFDDRTLTIREFCFAENISPAVYYKRRKLGLGSFLTPAQFRVVLCENCGLTRFFAERSALARLAKSRAWRHLQQETHV